MTETLASAAPAPEVTTSSAELRGVVPYLAVRGATDAIDWYARALGARLRGEPIVMPDGRVGHAEMALGDGGFMLSEEHPEIDVVAPAAGQGSAVTVHAEVDDVARIFAEAVDAGARAVRPPADHPYGRNAVLMDPFGHRWMLSGPVPAPADPVRQGDVVYVSWWVPDARVAARFYAAVLGWTYEGGDADRPRVAGAAPAHGFASGVTPPTLMLCFSVEDIEAAGARVRAAGGTAGPVIQEPWGANIDCTDDQGMRFALHQWPAGAPTAERPATTGIGDVAYITIHTPNSARWRAFSGAVLGWEWDPGRVEDGWEPRDTWPMIGLSGGHISDPVVIPMYRVPDIGAAVGAVRAAGGRATDPTPQPYGISSECVDDQGTRFYLGQLSD